MVESIDNDNQESARLLQERVVETSGGGYRHTAEPRTGGVGKAIAHLQCDDRLPIIPISIFMLLLHPIVMSHIRVPWTSSMKKKKAHKNSYSIILIR